MNPNSGVTLGPGAVNRDEGEFLYNRLLSFVDVKVLELVIEHSIIDRLAEKPMSIAELAQAVKLPERSVGYLFIGMGGMGLLDFEPGPGGGKYRPTPIALKYLVSTSPFFYGQAIRYWNWNLEAYQTRFTESVVEDKPIWEGFAHYLKEVSATGLKTNTDKQKIFNDSISLSMMFVANSVLERVDLRGRKRLLDIGGNHGRFSSTCVRRVEGLHATIFDLPSVCEQAKKQIAEWGLSERVDTHPGNFIEDEWPTGYDTISFVRILLTRTVEDLQTLFRRAYKALPSGGKLVVVDAPILRQSRGHYSPNAARLAILLSMKARGIVRHADEYLSFFTDAGFQPPEQIDFDDALGLGLLVATKK